MLPTDPGDRIDRREFGLRFLQFAALLAVPIRASATPRGAFAVTVDRDVMVAMRDGVRLATDLYRPIGEPGALGTFPVILERTPYGKSQATTRHASIEVAQILASHGYVVVYQDCRGRGNSGGDYVKYLGDGPDGFDCCKWLVEQPWCNGRIGTMGLSYAAHTQAALASAGAPGLVAMYMDSGGFSNAYQGGIRQGGAFELKQATWAFSQMLEAPEVQRDPAKVAALKRIDLHWWFANMPWARGRSPLSLVPEYEDYVFDQWEHGNFDAFWKQPGIYSQGFYDRYPNAAITLISSWYDPYPRTATDNYLGLKQCGKGPLRLILGPWTHGNREQTFSGDVDFGREATFGNHLADSYLDDKLRWFDRHLRAKTTESAEAAPVRIFVMGGGSGRKNAEGRLDHGGRWRSEAEWPLTRAKPRTFYLHRKGMLAEARPTDPDASSAYRYDPRHPVPTIGGTVTSGQPIMVGGAFDQREEARFFGSHAPFRPLAERPDVLVFQTSPLAADLEVTGDIRAELWIASSCRDTDFTIKLIDVHPPSRDYPNGFAMNLTDGILRCRYRDSWEKPSFMQPGRIYKVRVEAFPTSNLFKAGHRIRLDISSSNYPHFDLNTNTAEPEGRASGMRIATNRVYFDRRRPSHLVLPIVPA